MLNLYPVVLIFVYPIFLEEYYDDSLSNNSCFTKAASHINTIHWWYIKGQLIDMMSIDQRNWTGDWTKSASFDYQHCDKIKVSRITVQCYFSHHPCPFEHKLKFGMAYMYYRWDARLQLFSLWMRLRGESDLFCKFHQILLSNWHVRHF